MPIETTERFNVIFQQYPERILVSKKRRATYWEQKDKESLPKYLLKDLAEKKLSWQYYKGKGLCLYNDAERSFVIKNAKVAGTERYWTINSQKIWEGDQWMRQKAAEALHEYFGPGIVRQLPEEIFPPSPDVFLHFEYIFYYPFTARKEGEYQDYINHAYIRSKAFEDTLVSLGVIKDDGPRYVRGGYARYVNVATEVDRRLEVKIHFCKNGQRII